MQTSPQPNNPVKNQKRSRSANGSPQPYRDSGRWKAPGFVLDVNGEKHKVTVARASDLGIKRLSPVSVRQHLDTFLQNS